jgi:hypothetical protein
MLLKTAEGQLITKLSVDCNWLPTRVFITMEILLSYNLLSTRILLELKKHIITHEITNEIITLMSLIIMKKKKPNFFF